MDPLGAAVLAIARDDVAGLETALGRCVDINKPLASGKSLLCCAAELNKPRALDVILAANRDVVRTLEAETPKARQQERTTKTTTVTTRGSRPARRRRSHRRRLLPMRLATTSGFVDVAAVSRRLTADPNVSSNQPLFVACSKGHFECASALLAAGAREVDATPDPSGRTPLFAACEAGSLPVVELCLRFGACPDAAKHTNHRTPLIVACESIAKASLVDALVRDGKADVSKAMDGQWTPLYVASEHGNLRAVITLLNAGADVACVDTLGETPLHVAAERGRLDVAETLLNHGADIMARDVARKTPLFNAAASGHLDVVRLLLARACGGGVSFFFRKKNLDEGEAGRCEQQLEAAVVAAADNGHAAVLDFLLRYQQFQRQRVYDVQQRYLDDTECDAGTRRRRRPPWFFEDDGCRPQPRLLLLSTTPQ